MVKLNIKNIQFNDSNLSVTKYFNLLEKGTYELQDFKNLQKEFIDGSWDENMGDIYRLQELTIYEHLLRVIKKLELISK